MRLIAYSLASPSLRRHVTIALAALTACAWLFVVFFHRLGDRDLWNSHEARAAMDAQSILDDGDWLIPRLYDGRPELQKPPLYYWMVASIASLRGGEVDAWAVRIPSTITALVAAILLVLLGWRCGRLRDGCLAAIVLITMIHFTWLARVGRIDMPLTAAIAAALVCYYVGQAVPDTCRKIAWLAAGYLAITVAVLLKGPIGLVLPVAVVTLHLAIERQLPAPWRLREWATLAHRLGLWWGLPFVVLIVGAWFYLANQATYGELWRVFVIYHNVDRGLGGSNLRGYPFWYYGPRLIVDCLPWSLLLPIAVVRVARGGRWKADPLARFAMAWLGAMLLVLSLAQYKRADYLVPAYPGLALFLVSGLAVKSQTDKEHVSARNVMGQWLVAAVLACTALGWWLRIDFDLPRVEPLREYRTFASQVRQQASSDAPLVLFRTEAHAFAFHLGRPIQSLVWWEDVDQLQLGTHLVMPESVAADWRQELRNVILVERARTLSGHEKPLILFRVEPVHTMSKDRDR